MTEGHGGQSTQHSIEMVELTDGNALNVELSMERRDSIDSQLTGTPYLQVTR